MKISITHNKIFIHSSNENLIYRIVALYYDHAESYKIVHDIKDISVDSENVIFVRQSLSGTVNFAELSIYIEEDTIYLGYAPKTTPLGKFKRHSYSNILLSAILDKI